ncbi:MAG TPA: polysaccharide biosynthesis/export family protein, partial [Steroidobacteraceae bacterium]|nr:polysaccharide biosynthesis/export family protein [Steroidobacteraceae bacterium]
MKSDHTFRLVSVLMSALLLVTACAGGSGVRPVKGPPQPAADTAPQEYRIGPGDSLNVFVFNQPELSVTVPV